MKSRKRFIKSLESKIGSLHDTSFFIGWLEKKQSLIDAGEEAALKKIKREWQHDMISIRKELKPLLPAVRQVAIDLQGHSEADMNKARLVSV